MRKGYFISMEGIDGSGKSSQTINLKKYLEEKGYDVVLTREPGGTMHGEKIRELILTNSITEEEMHPETEAYLFAAARAQHVRCKIIPALEEGKIVITDRFVDSSLAYQGEMRGLGIEMVYDLNKLAIKNTLPDLTIFLTLNEDEYIKRNKGKELDRIEQDIDLNYFETINNTFNKIHEMFPERFVELNGDSSIEEVFNDISQLVEKKLEENKTLQLKKIVK